MLPIRDHTPSTRVPFVTIGLILLNVIAFWMEFSAADQEAFIRTWALVPANVNPGNPFSLIPFVTSQFLHAGFAHIAFNMWYLWIFGDNVEGRLGHVPYLLFYLIGGVAAALTQYIVDTGSDIPMLGASGAVAGVLGAYWALFPHHRVDTIMPGLYGSATLPAGTVLLFWFVAQLFSGTVAIVGGTAAGGGTAWFAHIGGFVFGWVIAKLFYSGVTTPSIRA